MVRWRTVLGGRRAKHGRREARWIFGQYVCMSVVSGVWHHLKASVVVAVLKSGLIDQANGSAYIETEKTKIACAVSVASFFFLCVSRI